MLPRYQDVSFSALPHPPCHDEWSPLELCAEKKSFLLQSFYVKCPVSMATELMTSTGYGGGYGSYGGGYGGSDATIQSNSSLFWTSGASGLPGWAGIQVSGLHPQNGFRTTGVRLGVCISSGFSWTMLLLWLPLCESHNVKPTLGMELFLDDKDLFVPFTQII